MDDDEATQQGAKKPDAAPSVAPDVKRPKSSLTAFPPRDPAEAESQGWVVVDWVASSDALLFTWLLKLADFA